MSMADFRRNLIQSIYSHVYQRVENNYDPVRFSFDGVDRSNSINGQANAQYLEFVLANIDAFYMTYVLLADGASRHLYLQVIKYRFLGHPHVRIRDDMTWSTVKAMYDKGASYKTGPSKLQFRGVFGEIFHHDKIPTENGSIALDGWSAGISYGIGSGQHRQYYLRRGDVRICPEPGDYVIDGGACLGDTAAFFASSVGKKGKVFAFDPMPSHVDVINYNVRQNGMEDRIVVVPAGIGAKSNNVVDVDPGINAMASPGFSLIGKENTVPVVSIDDFVASHDIKKIDFIKMDVEGFEFNALQGAAKTIEKHRPKLAISLYHKPQDFFEIPQYLKLVFPFYSFYLDHYTIFGEETVLYAVA